MEELHQVMSAEPLDDTHVRVSFDTGDIAIFDCEPYMREKYWACLKSPAYFRQVKAEYGMLCWPNDIDIAPEDVWEDAVRRPKSEVDRPHER